MRDYLITYLCPNSGCRIGVDLHRRFTDAAEAYRSELGACPEHKVKLEAAHVVETPRQQQAG